MIYLQFSSTPTLISKAIQLFTWSWASHVDFVLPSGSLFGAMNDGGVKVHSPVKYSRVEIYKVNAPSSVLDFAFSQNGKPYDWTGIFGLIARNRDWEDKSKWFCSELVAFAFKAALRILLLVKPGQTHITFTPSSSNSVLMASIHPFLH